MDTGMLASLLPDSIMHTEWFAALTMFVAINTLLYLTLAVVKLLPKAYLSDWVERRDRRGETRSIHPDADRPAMPDRTRRPPLAPPTSKSAIRVRQPRW